MPLLAGLWLRRNLRKGALEDSTPTLDPLRACRRPLRPGAARSPGELALGTLDPLGVIAESTRRCDRRPQELCPLRVAGDDTQPRHRAAWRARFMAVGSPGAPGAGLGGRRSSGWPRAPERRPAPDGHARGRRRGSAPDRTALPRRSRPLSQCSKRSRILVPPATASPRQPRERTSPAPA